MLNLRSPYALFWIGIIALGGGLAAWMALGDGVVSWGLLVLALAAVFEFGALEEAAIIASYFYQEQWRDIERAIYEPRASLVRFGLLTLYLAGVVTSGRAFLDVIKESLPSLIAVFGPLLIFVAWAGLSYWRAIRRAADTNEWRRIGR